MALLKSRGADIEAQDHLGDTPLETACRMAYVEYAQQVPTLSLDARKVLSNCHLTNVFAFGIHFQMVKMGARKTKKAHRFADVSQIVFI